MISKSSGCADDLEQKKECHEEAERSDGEEGDRDGQILRADPRGRGQRDEFLPVPTMHRPQ